MTIFLKVNFMQGTVDFLLRYLYPTDILFCIPYKLRQEGHDGPRVAHLSLPDCVV